MEIDVEVEADPTREAYYTYVSEIATAFERARPPKHFYTVEDVFSEFAYYQDDFLYETDPQAVLSRSDAEVDDEARKQAERTTNEQERAELLAREVLAKDVFTAISDK